MSTFKCSFISTNHTTIIYYIQYIYIYLFRDSLRARHLFVKREVATSTNEYVSLELILRIVFPANRIYAAATRGKARRPDYTTPDNLKFGLDEYSMLHDRVSTVSEPKGAALLEGRQRG